ncbi:MULTISPECIES: hypothetical protein [unclassified Microcoleus]
MQRAKQERVVREQLLRWEKTASDCDRSLFGNGGKRCGLRSPCCGNE